MEGADVESIKQPRARKTEIQSPDEFATLVNETAEKWRQIYIHFVGNNKKGLNLEETAPGKNEFASVEKQIRDLEAAYKRLHRKIKKKTKKNPDGGEGKGFKQARYVNKLAVEFVNKYGDLPANLKLMPLADAGGDAIWNIAQGTQLIVAYCEVNGLKNSAARSHITLNEPLVELFKPFFPQVDKKLITEKDGKYIITQTTLQSLLPKLFDRELPVLDTDNTEEEKKRTRDRETLLKERTEANRVKRENIAKDKKAENKARAKAAKIAKAEALIAEVRASQ
jgi:hypothetical protein